VSKKLDVPIVSIGMCTYNSQNTIDRAIKSVLEQEFKYWELLVVDANSHDQTLRKVIKFSQKDNRIKHFSLNYQSPWVESSLIALNYASGKYFMFLDGDDFISSNYISCLINEFSDKSIVGSVGRVNLIDTSGVIIDNNPSTNNIFKFTSSSKHWYRVSGALLTPESLGLVNCLYGLWNKDYLRNLDLWKKETRTKNFDQIFVLNALKKGKIKYTNKTIQFRSSFRAGPAKGKNIIKRITFLRNAIQFFVTIPPVHSYFIWIVKNMSSASFLYLFIVILRTIISSFVYVWILMYKRSGLIITKLTSPRLSETNSRD
jgi:glycosyltransferase involved in cell wall biosynthesis